jgi:hypothetical protein
MDEDALFKVLKRQTKATLLELLYSAYYETNTQQRRHVFGDLMKESKSSKNLAQDIIRESENSIKIHWLGYTTRPLILIQRTFSIFLKKQKNGLKS